MRIRHFGRGGPDGVCSYIRVSKGSLAPPLPPLLHCRYELLVDTTERAASQIENGLPTNMEMAMTREGERERVYQIKGDSIYTLPGVEQMFSLFLSRKKHSNAMDFC